MSVATRYRHGWKAVRAACALLTAVGGTLYPAAGTVFAGTSAAAGDCSNADWAPKSVRQCSEELTDAKMDPRERGRIYTLRGHSWLKEEEPVAAVSDFSRAIAIDATNISALRGRAHSQFLLGRHELALADWSRIIDIRPKDEEYYRSRGAVYLAAGKTEAALADYQKALDLDPKSVAAYVGRAAVFEALDEREKALSDFSEALQIDPSYVPAYWERGQMAERWGDKKLAVDSYLTLLQYDDNYWDAQKALQKHGVYRWHRP